MEKENNTKENLVWIDLEFTGLDYANNQILEIATIITDKDLNILATGPNLAIQTEKNILDNLDQWNTETHGKSGLLQKCLDSKTTMKMAEAETLDFIEKWAEQGEALLCGNSVCSDRRMLYKNMPRIEKFLSYRNINVTTVKKLAHNWYPELPNFEKKETHTALLDITESIEELKYYRENIFKK